MDRNLSPRLFKFDEPLVALRPLNLDGTPAGTLAPGDPIPDGILTGGQKLRLWMCSHVVYASQWHPTPTADDIDVSQVVVDPEEVEKAVAEFEASSPHEVVSSHIGGGWYLLTPSWDESLAEKVQTKTAVEARIAELIAAAPAAPAVVEDAAEAAPQPEAQPEAADAAAAQPEAEAEHTGD